VRKPAWKTFEYRDILIARLFSSVILIFSGCVILVCEWAIGMFRMVASLSIFCILERLIISGGVHFCNFIH